MCRSAYAWHMLRHIRQVVEPYQTVARVPVTHYLATFFLAHLPSVSLAVSLFHWLSVSPSRSLPPPLPTSH